MPSFPVFPWKHEPWIQCYICGFSIPLSEGVMHYRFRKLVCKRDDDKPSHLDYREFQDMPTERDDTSPQKVLISPTEL